MHIEKINIKDIVPDASQPRKTFDEDKLEELANSIQKYGLLQPVIVRKQGDKFIIIAGERRYRACKIINLPEISCIIKDDENAAEIALIENIQREDLDPVEEALAILELKEKKNYTHENIASVLGKTRTYVTNKLRILTLDDRSREFLREKKISEGHARALLSEKDIKKRDSLVDRIINEGLNVRETEKIVRSSKSQNSEFENEISIAKEMLEDSLSTKVSIRSGKDQKGSIIIDFYSYEQLRDIVNYILDER